MPSATRSFQCALTKETLFWNENKNFWNRSHALHKGAHTNNLFGVISYQLGVSWNGILGCSKAKFCHKNQGRVLWHTKPQKHIKCPAISRAQVDRVQRKNRRRYRGVNDLFNVPTILFALHYGWFWFSGWWRSWDGSWIVENLILDCLF